MQVDEPAGAPRGAPTSIGDSPAAADASTPQQNYLEVPLTDVVPNPHQPRKRMGPASLAELAASIKVNGVIQPLIVRRKDDGYELIAGERRLQASRLAQLKTVPVVVRDVDEAVQAEMALVENIQREDLNPVDRGEAYRALQRRLGLSQADLATRLGEERATVNNHLRLLDLPSEAIELARNGELPIGHAKVILGVPDENEQLRLARLVAQQGISVRDLERLTRTSTSAGDPKKKAEQEAKDAYLDQLAETLSRSIGTECSVRAAGRGGYRLTLTLQSAEQFDRLMERFDVSLHG